MHKVSFHLSYISSDTDEHDSVGPFSFMFLSSAINSLNTSTFEGLCQNSLWFDLDHSNKSTNWIKIFMRENLNRLAPFLRQSWPCKWNQVPEHFLVSIVLHNWNLVFPMCLSDVLSDVLNRDLPSEGPLNQEWVEYFQP